MPKGPSLVCSNTHNINPNVGSFHVPTPKEVKNCKEFAKVSSPNKHITSNNCPNKTHKNMPNPSQIIMSNYSC
jgi:hypothetical protein